MSDPLQGQKLPASVITPEVAEVMAAAPQPVFFPPFKDRMQGATVAQLMALAHGGVGEPVNADE